MAGRLISRTWQHDPILNAPPRYRKACAYQAFVPDPLSERTVQLASELAGLISEAEGAVRNLNAHARPALEPLARLLLRTESIASSKVEGMHLGLRELARAEARLDAGGRVGPTAREIIANIESMEMAIEAATVAERFSMDEILDIHRRLLEPSPQSRTAGRLRTVQNWIGGNDYNPCGADFVPPPPEYLDDLLADLCAAIEDDLLPPLVQAALVHAQFETIHPFDDGNGRTGRALIHVILRRRKLAPAYVPPISVVLAASRDRYIRGLTDFREGRMEVWLEHFAGAVAKSAYLAADHLAAVQALKDRWVARLNESPDAPRSDAAAWALIDVLPGHPIITAGMAAAATGRSRPQIYRGLAHLESSGILIPLSSGRRNRSWEASGLLDLLAGLDAGEPAPRHGAMPAGASSSSRRISTRARAREADDGRRRSGAK